MPPERVYMVPKAGVRVTHPAGSPKAMRRLPTEGEWVTLDHYWQRRLDDGSVMRTTPPDQIPAAAAPAAKGKP